jgi:hypothetical protein
MVTEIIRVLRLRTKVVHKPSGDLYEGFVYNKITGQSRNTHILRNNRTDAFIDAETLRDDMVLINHVDAVN